MKIFNRNINFYKLIYLKHKKKMDNLHNLQQNFLNQDVSFIQKDFSTNQGQILDISPIRFNKEKLKRPASSSILHTNKPREISNSIKNLKKLNVNVNVNVHNPDK